MLLKNCKKKWKFWILILYISELFQGSDCQTSQNINVLFINEVGNDVAQKAVNVAVDYVKKTSELGMSVEVMAVEGNRTDSKGLLESVCMKLAESIEKKTPPHVIFDTTKTGVSSETVKSVSAALGIPTVSASYGQDGDLRQWRDISDKKARYLLQVMPPADIIIEIIRKIVQFNGITNAAILYDETFVVDHKYKALLQNIPTRHVITAIAKDGDREEQLVKLRNLDINNYFILGTVESIKKVLESAKKEYFERNFAWHAIAQARQDLNVKVDNATVMFIRPTPDSKTKNRLGLIKQTYNLKMEPEVESAFYFDLALRTFMAIKQMLSDGSWPSDIKYMTCDEYDGSNSPDHAIDLRKAFIDAKVEPTYADFYFPTNDKEKFNGNAMMKFDTDLNAIVIRNGASVSTKALGTWKAGIDSNLSISAVEEMKNLTANTVYRVYTVVQAPFIMRDENSPKGFKGYCIDLIDEIAKIVNFDYDIKVVEDGKFGDMNDNGEWNGVVRKLMDKQADIGLGSMSVMAERETVIDFTVPYYDLVGITILMQQPHQEPSLFKFLTVLETNVWLCILGAYFFTSLLMWVFDRYSPYSYQNNREKYKEDEEKREFTLKECLWFCMTSLTPQGGGEAPKNLSGRLIAATWWLFGFIIIASYTANLAAFLTVSRLDQTIESLEDLAKQYKILYAPLNGSSAMTYFQRMANIEHRFYEIWKDMSLNDSLTPVERSKLAVWDYPVSDRYTKMWQAMQDTKLPNTLDEAVIRVRNTSTSQGFAFLGDATDIRYLVLTNCDLQVIGEEFSRKPYAIAVQQGSPLKDQFNNAILQLLNKRQLEKMKEKWWKKDDVAARCDKSEEQSDGISIQNIGGVFIVIFVGIGLACVTLIFEYWYYKFRKTGNKIFGGETEFPMQKSMKHQQTIKNMTQFGSTSGSDPLNGKQSTLKSRNPAAGNFRARF